MGISYSQLNPKQKQAANHVHGPMLVLAGAGTGKTSVLVHRISRLITSKQGSAGDQVACREVICGNRSLRAARLDVSRLLLSTAARDGRRFPASRSIRAVDISAPASRRPAAHPFFARGQSRSIPQRSAHLLRSLFRRVGKCEHLRRIRISR